MKESIPVNECQGGVTAPKGFVAGGLYCGIRKMKKDLAMIRSVNPAVIAGVFTLNRTQAAPILVGKVQLQRSKHGSAVVVNGGIAAGGTGPGGVSDAWEMVRMT